MANIKPELTRVELKKLLHYNEETGHFTWKIAKTPRVKVGDVAGIIRKTGDIVIGINGKIYAASPLAFFYKKGKWPERKILHINKIKSDNSWENLKESERRIAQKKRKTIIKLTKEVNDLNKLFVNRTIKSS
jgi:hypothetical protein